MTTDFGLLLPFQRDQKRDFAGADGDTLRQSHLQQALLTRRGELLWDTERGSQLHFLRHATLSPAMLEIAKSYAAQAVARDLRGEKIIDVSASKHGESLRLDICTTNEQGRTLTTAVIVGGEDVAKSAE